MSAPSTSTPRGFYYALYNYHPHRVQQQHDQDSDAPDSVASFLRKEAVVDGDFSLTCSRHSLDSLAVETQLRDFISRRLSRGAVYTGSGDVMPVDIKDMRSPLACYFSLLRVHPGTQDSNNALSPSPEFVRRREYIVCYVTDREEIDLLPFRTELDTHAQELQELLKQVNPADSSQVAGDVVSHLQSWHKTCLYFVSRCVDCIGVQLPTLLYSSLCCLPMEISSTDKVCTREDLQSLANACSLTALMQAQLQAAKHSVVSAPLIELDLLGEDVVDAATTTATTDTTSDSRSSSISVCVTPGGCTMSSSTSNSFCEEWAVAMRSVPDKENPSVLRQIIENFKLRANQHMNTLKRLLRNAETDHYTLYRAFVFLETCGMGQILLSAASKDAEDSGSTDSHEVCKVLREFIQSLPAASRLEHGDAAAAARQANTV